MNNLYSFYNQNSNEKPAQNKLDEKTVAKDTQRFFREIIKNTETVSSDEKKPSPSPSPEQTEED